MCRPTNFGISFFQPLEQQQQPEICIFKRGVKKPKIEVKLLQPVQNLGRAGDTVSVMRGYMRYELYPRQLAEYIYRVEPKKRNLVTGVELEWGKDIMTLPGIKPTEINFKFLHQIQVNMAIVQHITKLTFTRAVSLDPKSSSQIVPTVRIEHIMQRLETYGATLEKYNLMFPQYLGNEVRTFGEHRCLMLFPEIRQKIWLMLNVSRGT
ncbi:hypothetical protein G9A89_014556 [Geosiphon pyriformis]|nr:hypothetical protein G9A89_014556 [Geosiphon pyriformis]